MHLALCGEAGARAVREEDLPVWEVDELGHYARRGHVLDGPALRDACGRERDAGVL